MSPFSLIVAATCLVRVDIEMIPSLASCSNLRTQNGLSRKGQCFSQGRIRAIAPSKTYESTVILFTMILYNSENSIRDIRPFCRPLFCHSSVVKCTSCLLQTVMRLDYQILLKSL